MGAHPRWRWSTTPNQVMNPDSETTSVFLDLSPHLIHRTYIIINPCPLYPSLYFPSLLRLSYRHFYDCLWKFEIPRNLRIGSNGFETLYLLCMEQKFRTNPLYNFNDVLLSLITAVIACHPIFERRHKTFGDM